MSLGDLPHLAGRLFGTPLMIAQPKLDTVLGVLHPRLFGGERLDAAETTPEPAPYVVTPSGIAVIPVFGTLVNRAHGLTALSGLTSYQRLGGHLAQAAADPAVRGILLDIDSPGGEAGGVFDLADRVAALRGVKPVHAVAAEACFSAAYALACGAERLVLTRTAGVGSVGVVALHLDQSGADARAGLHYEYLSAGARKIDGHPHAPLSDGARAALQAEVDRLYGLFVAHVARCRGLPEAQVRDQQAALYFGGHAVAAGLADGIGTLATALAGLGARLSRSTPGGSMSRTTRHRPIHANSSDPVPDPPPEDRVGDEDLPVCDGCPTPGACREQGVCADTGQPLGGEEAPAGDPAETAALRRRLAAEVAARAGGSHRPAPREARLRAEAAEILEVCQIGGCPGAAAGFVRRGLTPAQVRKALLDVRADRYEASAVTPADATAPAGDNPLIAAIKARYPAPRRT